jgi:hypothetical protein
MKNLIFTGLFVLLLSACQQPQRYTQQSPEIETFKAVINAYDTKDWENLVTHFADTAKIHFNNVPPFKAANLPDYHTQTDAYYSSRGFVLEGQEYEMAQTDDGKTWVNFWGTWKGTLDATNKEYTLPIHLTAQFIDGKIVEEYGYWDGTEITLAIQDIESKSDNVKTIEEAYANFASGDIPAFLAKLDPKIVWNEAESFIYAGGNPYIGPDAIVKGVFQPIGAEWEYWNLVDLQLMEMKNGMVLATGRYQAKNKANGNILNAQMAHVWTLNNGKITKFQQYTDTKHAFDVYQ